jgi:hypothetical protein
MGIVSWFKGLFKDSPAQDAFEEAKGEWRGSDAYTAKRHAWFQRENMCSGSGEAPVIGSVRVTAPKDARRKRRKRGVCRVCAGHFSVSRKSLIAVHKRRV